MRHRGSKYSRRRFLQQATAAVAAGSGLCRTSARAVSGRTVWSTDRPAPNLVPQPPAQTPNYWCTWGAQATTTKDPQAGGQMAASDNLNETLIFKDPGWLTHYFDKIRQDLFVVYDGGWDVPIGHDFTGDGRWRLGIV